MNRPRADQNVLTATNTQTFASEGIAPVSPLRALVEKWRERGRKIEPLRHKAIQRGDGGAADVYDAKQRALFASADDLDALLSAAPGSTLEQQEQDPCPGQDVLPWLQQAVLDYEQRTYRPTAHYLLVLKGAIAEIQRLRSASPGSPWRPIASAKKGHTVLVYMAGTAGLGIYRAVLANWKDGEPNPRWRPVGYTLLDEFPSVSQITYWMPLPSPPSGSPQEPEQGDELNNGDALLDHITAALSFLDEAQAEASADEAHTAIHAALDELRQADTLRVAELTAEATSASPGSPAEVAAWQAGWREGARDGQRVGYRQAIEVAAPPRIPAGAVCVAAHLGQRRARRRAVADDQEGADNTGFT